LDQSTYTFKALSTKYGDFRGPAFLISINGKALNSSEMPIVSLEVELCADGSAGGCRFVVESLYDYETYKWVNRLEKTIEVGAKLEIQAGYVKKETVFYGYVDECFVSYSGSEPPRMEVIGIDGFGYLMSCQEPIYGGKKQPKRIVEEILQKCVAAGYAKRCTVGNLSGFTIPIIKERIDDYKYLRLLAERYCMSLLAVDGELIFDDVISKTKPLITLTVGAGLLHFGKRRSLRGQVGEVEVWGRDENQHFIHGSAKSVTLGGNGKTAVQIAGKFKKTVLREYSEYVRTEAECVRSAQARLNALALNFVSGEGVCVGLPELIPGRYITVAGLDGDTEGDYFVSKVRHSFTQDGYFTQFEVKGARA
jgi:uncharacterized protein